MTEIKIHTVLVLTHKLFGVVANSGLPIEDQILSASMLGELLKHSRDGYALVNLEQYIGETNRNPDTQYKTAPQS